MDTNITTHHYRHHHHLHHQTQEQQVVKTKRSRESSGKREKDGVKVVYISTPMKVKTSASKFRAIVQELTGRESDVVRIMETSGGRDTWTVPDYHQNHHHDVQGSFGAKHDGVPPLVMGSNSMKSSPSSSEELISEPFDGVLVRGQERFGLLDSASMLYDQFCCQLDVIGRS